jgi:hypothetical protein
VVSSRLSHDSRYSLFSLSPSSSSHYIITVSEENEEDPDESNLDISGVDESELALLDQRKRASRLFWVQAAYISVVAMLGALLRIVMAQFLTFGGTCNSPGMVGWLSSESPLCVTADGVVSQAFYGILFVDLPANLLGCLLMGMFTSGKSLDLALPLPM